MDQDQYERGKIKDFLAIYNKIAECCFSHCVNNLNQRNLTSEENINAVAGLPSNLPVHVNLDKFACVDMCAEKNINTNHRMMQVYIEVQPDVLKRRYEEAEKLAQQTTS